MYWRVAAHGCGGALAHACDTAVGAERRTAFVVEQGAARLGEHVGLPNDEHLRALHRGSDAGQPVGSKANSEHATIQTRCMAAPTILRLILARTSALRQFAENTV